MREEIAKRQEANLEIVKILERLPIGNLQLELINGDIVLFPNLFRILSEEYPQQRAGQIICNYICPDYRSQSISTETNTILETLFPGNPDPFFEESITTLKRLKTILK